MTKEELQQAIRRNQEKMQDDYIDKVYDEISYLCEKAISKEYEPTNHERFIFNEIKNIIDNMSKWF